MIFTFTRVIMNSIVPPSFLLKLFIIPRFLCRFISQIKLIIIIITYIILPSGS